jgi:hypothetical protein
VVSGVGVGEGIGVGVIVWYGVTVGAAGVGMGSGADAVRDPQGREGDRQRDACGDETMSRDSSVAEVFGRCCGDQKAVS